MARLSGLVLLVAGALAGKSVEEHGGCWDVPSRITTTGDNWTIRFCHMFSLEDPYE